MEHYEKILVLNNQFEAERMEEILMDKEIPYAIIPYTDSAWGGLMRLEKGWGYLEAPPRFKEEVEEIYNQIANASGEEDSGKIVEG